MTEEDDDDVEDEEGEEDRRVGRDNDFYDEIEKSDSEDEPSLESPQTHKSVGRLEQEYADALRSASQHTSVSRRNKSMKNIATYNG